MITLAFIEHCLSAFNTFISHFPIFANVIDTFSNILQEFSWVVMPTALVNIFRICRCFLPVATIVVLFIVGGLMTAIQILSGIIYFLTHLGNIV